MDAFYDVAAAKNALTQLVAERCSGKNLGQQLSTYGEQIPTSLSTLITASPAGIRLTTSIADAVDIQEVVLRVQGAICFAQLPPIRAGRQLPERGDARFLKQTIRLTGFGSAEFQQAVSGIANIATLMGDNLERGDIESWKPERYRTWQTLDIGNRYFRRQNNEGDAVPISLPRNVDPDGILAKLAGDEWVHTEDNEVRYFGLVPSVAGKPKYEPIDPSEFKLGDIVEVQCSAVGIRRRGREEVYNLRLVLRALTLLDASHGKAARANRMQQAIQSPQSPARGIKRTVGYLDDDSDHDEENSVPTAKMTKLTVNDAAASGIGSQSPMQES
ncbi:hypothetical protein HWV62_34205 [Athelia sp. TMB]|nr:hypothetical protein HWV62_34205 [Athelia sp. TMB]